MDVKSEKTFLISAGILVHEAVSLNNLKTDSEVKRHISKLLQGFLRLYSEKPKEFTALVGRESGSCIELFVQVQEKNNVK